MDRLPALNGQAAWNDGRRVARAITAAVALLCVTGCDDTRSAPPPSRVVAVAAEAAADEDLCDVRPDRTFVPPALAEGTPIGPGSLRWINVWATWCRPCVDEMPLLMEWRERLAAARVEVDVVFLSADGEPDAVQTFRAAHPQLALDRRIADPTTLPAWATSVGLDPGAPLPIHLFVDGRGSVRCARAGALRESDYDAVRSMLEAL